MNKFTAFSNGSPRQKCAAGDMLSIELWAFVAALAIAAIPIFLVRVPPMLDYPNHYARLWLELGGIAVQPVSNFYALDWSKAGINIGIDLIAALLQGIASVGVVGPLVLCLALLLPPIGIAMLSRKVHGRLSYWHVLCVLLGWGAIYFFGFLNFAISLGLALIAASSDFSLIRLHPIARSGIRATVGYAIAVFHPFGFVFYVGLLAALTIGSDWAWLRSGRALWFKFCAVISAVAPPIILVFIVIFIFLPTAPGSDSNNENFGLHWAPFSIHRIINILASPFKSYNLKLDAFFIVILATPVVVAFFMRSIKVHAGLFLLSTMFAILSLLMPTSAFGTGGTDMRFPPMMAMAFVVAVLPTFPRFAKMPIAGVALVISLIGIRSGYIGYVWVAAQKDFGAMKRSLEHLPLGARLLTVANYPAIDAAEDYPVGRTIGRTVVAFWHYPALAIIDRHAFIPTLFTAAGKQPITVRAPYDRIAVREGTLPGVESLAANVDRRANVPKYMENWESCFEYVLVLNADMPNEKGPIPALPELQLVSNEDFATLYKVNKSSESCFR